MISDKVEAKLRKYAEELSELGRGPVDTDLFEWEVEQEWRERGDAIWEYFSGAPNELRLWAESELEEICWLEAYFLEREDYEKCAVLVRLQESWRQEFSGKKRINKKKKKNHDKRI